MSTEYYIGDILYLCLSLSDNVVSTNKSFPSFCKRPNTIPGSRLILSANTLIHVSLKDVLHLINVSYGFWGINFSWAYISLIFCYICIIFNIT